MMKFSTRKFKCLSCNYEFEVPFGIPKWSIKCKKCSSSNLIRVDKEGNFCNGSLKKNKVNSIFDKFTHQCKNWFGKFGNKYRCCQEEGWNKRGNCKKNWYWEK